MKRNHFLFASLAVLPLVAVVLLRPQSRPTTQDEPSAPSTELAAIAEATSASTLAVTAPAPQPAPPPLNAPPEDAAVREAPPAPELRLARIRSDQVLATVNGVPLMLADLMPVKPAATDETRTLEPDMYEMLLSRAVERELACQSAKVNGVTLTEAQQQNLARRLVQGDQAEPGEFDNLGRSTVNGDFEQRDAAGLMLLHNLAAAAGVPSPHVTTDQVGQYYTQHQAEYPAVPREAAKAEAVATAIDAAIRTRLAPEMKARHAEQFRQFVEQLKAGAQITIARPT